MNSRERLKKTVEKSFNKQNLRQLVADFLKDCNQKQVSLNSFYPSFSEHFNQFNLLGEYQDSKGKKIHILEVELKNAHKLEYTRTAQRNLIAKYLGDNWIDGALVGFWAPDYSRWRFSFVRLDWEFDEENKRTRKVLTPAKRYSFLIGEGEPSHTAQSQILPILEQEKQPTLEEIEKAFSVEQVTKDFYREYKKLFDKLCQELNENRVFQIIRETKRIDTKDFAKKLLGQIVFLYFIQKKGWLGVPMDKKWGEGDRSFLRSIFEKAKGEGKNFFNDYLEVLFYNTLNNPRRKEVDPSYSKLFGCKIPFLNGGLFEPMKGYDWERSFLLMDNNLFSNSEDTGILDIFDRYNFTVKEDEPLEKEVAVDPEMLGKVFENLLEENLRKGKGTYYTPREIVHYMCQESLINYLITESKIDEEKIRTLVTRDMLLTKEDVKKATQNEKARKTISDKVLTFWETEAERLEETLKDIKVVDPACGSGAFLVGMLQEIVKARQVLQLFTGKELNEYQLKKETIQNCIYGVDIDPGAVEIAKLRFWLSLVVDYELKEIEPLPNLDYKVMQGNSLLEELVLGDTAIKLFDPNLVINEKKKMKNLFEEEKQEDLFEEHTKTKEVMKKLDRLRKKYFRISELSEKSKIKSQIEDIEQNLVKQCVDKEVKNLDAQLKNIGRYITPGIGMRHKDAKKQEKVVSTKAGIMEMWRAFRESGVRPFFLWHLYFADVFQQKGGFDVVIANPPYVRADSPKIKGQRRLIKQSKNYQTLYEKWDLYVAFIERSFQILTTGGVLEYIIPDAYMSSKYASKSHEYFLKKATINRINFLNEIKVFEAAVKNIIIEFKKVADPLNVPLKIKHLPTFNDFIKLPSRPQEEMGELTFKVESKNRVVGNLENTLQWGEICYVSVGLVLQAEERQWQGEFVKEDLISTKKDNVHKKPYVEAKWIKRYIVEKIKYLEWDTDRVPRKIRRPTFPELYLPKKIMMGGMTGAILDDKGLLCNHSITVSVLWKDLSGVNNRSVFGSIKKDFQTKNVPSFRAELEKKSKEFDLKYLLSILNSKLGKYYLSKVRRSQIGFYPDDLKKLPIKKISKDDQKPFIDLVDKILAITKNPEGKPSAFNGAGDDYLENATKQAKVRKYEKQIDQLVYKLYGLTEEEIKVVEHQNNDKKN